MGFRLRKSINVGGIRFNLSSSGVGVSTGIKGLRIGVNARGKPYVAGGSHGVYFRENLNAPQSSIHNESARIKLSGYSIIAILSGITALILSGILWGSGKASAMPICLVGIFILLSTSVYESWRKGKIETERAAFRESIRQLREKIKLFVEQGNTHEVMALIKEVKEKGFSEEDVSYIFDDTYYTFLKNALKDKVLSDDEIEIINELKAHISAYEYEELNNKAVIQLFCEIIDDQKITKDEEDSVLHIMSVLQLSDTTRAKILNTMNQFKKIQDIAENGIKTIAVDNEVVKNNPCFYEGTVSSLSKKTDRYGNVIYSEKDTGKLFVTDRTIEMLIDGHKTIKIASIIDIINDSDRLEFTIKERKTTMSINSNEPFYVMLIINKVKSMI